MMADQFDKELELAKLQIAADACLADKQIYLPLSLSTVVVFFVLGCTIVFQPYSEAEPLAKGLAFATLCLAAVWVIVYLLTRYEYENGIKQLDRYVEDLKAGKPLPSLIVLCGVKEKK
jgi:hypothetical protein